MSFQKQTQPKSQFYTTARETESSDREIERKCERLGTESKRQYVTIIFNTWEKAKVTPKFQIHNSAHDIFNVYI